MSVFLKQKYAIIDQIRKSSEMTRPEISQRTQISLPTLSTLTRDCIGAGLITREGYLPAPRGRHADKLIINPDLCRAIGIQLSSTRMSGVVTDARGAVTSEREAADYKPNSVEVILAALKEIARELLDRAGGQKMVSGIAGLGVGVSGLVRKDQKTSREFPELAEWRDIPLGEILSREFGVPAFVLNDVHATTLAEYRFGAAQGISDFIYLHMGRGMAVGIMADGRLYTGGNNYAGEIGHVVVDPQGPVCFCGNYGCLESLVSPSALVAQCAEALGKGARTAAGKSAEEITIWSILRAANEKDRLAMNIITSAGRHLGLVLANLINVLNPSLVILGGVLAAPESEFFRATIIEAFRASVLPLVRPETEVRSAALGSQACAIGAAGAVLDNFFREDSPRLAALLAYHETNGRKMRKEKK